MEKTTIDNGWKFLGRMFLYWIPVLMLKVFASLGHVSVEAFYIFGAVSITASILLEILFFKRKRYILALIAMIFHPLIAGILYWIDREMLDPATNGGK